jgi:hypothetical protein
MYIPVYNTYRFLYYVIIIIIVQWLRRLQREQYNIKHCPTHIHMYNVMMKNAGILNRGAQCILVFRSRFSSRISYADEPMEKKMKKINKNH